MSVPAIDPITVPAKVCGGKIRMKRGSNSQNIWMDAKIPIPMVPTNPPTSSPMYSGRLRVLSISSDDLTSKASMIDGIANHAVAMSEKKNDRPERK